MKKIFCVFLVALMLFAFVGCNDAKTNGKTIIGTFEDAECYVMTDVLSLDVGEYESLFFISNVEIKESFSTHITEQKIPCKIFVFEENVYLREHRVMEEREDGSKIVNITNGENRDYGNFLIPKEDCKDKVQKTYIIKTYLPDDSNPFGYTERAYLYDSETQTWK